MNISPKANQLIYLASPYSHIDHQVEISRYKIAARVSAAILSSGYNVYSPICHSHPIHIYGGLSGKWEQWQQLNKHMMMLSNELWIASIDGWKTSTGVRAEIEFFRGLGRDILLIGMNAHGGQFDNFTMHESCLWWQARYLQEDDLI